MKQVTFKFMPGLFLSIMWTYPLLAHPRRQHRCRRQDRCLPSPTSAQSLPQRDAPWSALETWCPRGATRASPTLRKCHRHHPANKLPKYVLIISVFYYQTLGIPAEMPTSYERTKYVWGWKKVFWLEKHYFSLWFHISVHKVFLEKKVFWCHVAQNHMYLQLEKSTKYCSKGTVGDVCTWQFRF